MNDNNYNIKKQKWSNITDIECITLVSFLSFDFIIMKYGDGFSRNNLYRFISFFKSFPDIFNTAIGEIGIVPSLTGQSEKVPSPIGFSDGQDIYGQFHTEKEDYYIDLVFYNYHLRCFVLIDLKTNKLSYQDVGQMDMYVKMYDELVRPDGHNPTIGILLCADTDEDVAHYSVLNNNDQLFAAKYLTYMPTQEELRREIEQQKEFYRLQNDG